jgi:hypothetical protein
MVSPTSTEASAAEFPVETTILTETAAVSATIPVEAAALSATNANATQTAAVSATNANQTAALSAVDALETAAMGAADANETAALSAADTTGTAAMGAADANGTAAASAVDAFETAAVSAADTTGTAAVSAADVSENSSEANSDAEATIDAEATVEESPRSVRRLRKLLYVKSSRTEVKTVSAGGSRVARRINAMNTVEAWNQIKDLNFGEGTKFAQLVRANLQKSMASIRQINRVNFMKSSPLRFVQRLGGSAVRHRGGCRFYEEEDYDFCIGEGDEVGKVEDHV